MNNINIIKHNLKKRYAKETRFKVYALFAILISLAFLLFLLLSITYKSIPAFTQTYIKLDINFAKNILGLDEKNTYSKQELFNVNYSPLVTQALYRIFPDTKTHNTKNVLTNLISSDAQYSLRNQVLADPLLLTNKKSIWVLASTDVDSFVKNLIDRNIPESDRRVKDLQIKWIDYLVKEGRIEKRFNLNFFIQGDSREPEQAGIFGALKGSFYTMLITLLLSFPVAVATAIYLEEFAPKNNWWIDLIEVNINNLAAVPSVVFGILGMAIYINLFGIPRSSALAGGLTLSLMTLPTIIITARASLKSVPISIREAVLSVGASKVQLVFHHILPLAMPGILTGSIIGMAQALGETAPLLIIGMVAFIADIPQSITNPATVLPVQIYIWSESPERGFIALTSAAIVVLLSFLILMNLIAVILRKNFEVRW